MANGMVVCGHIGGEITYYVDTHPRSGVCAELLTPITTKMQIGGDAYHISKILTDLGVNIHISGIIGDDAFGRKTYTHINRVGIDRKNLHIEKGDRTPELLYFIDRQGTIISYSREHSALKKQDPSLLTTFNAQEIDYAVITTLNSQIRELAFTSLSALNIPIIWHAQGYAFDMKPDNLLKYIHSTKYLILSTHEEKHFCDMLGLSNIEILLTEGIKAIVVIEYKNGSYAYNILTNTAISTHHFGLLMEKDNHGYRHAILGFVAGFSYAAHLKEDLETIIKTGIACAEENIINVHDNEHVFDDKKIKQRLQFHKN